MKIANITASLHRHEIDLPGIGESIESRMFVFVEVETDTGVKGLGCTGQFLPWSTMPCIEDHIFPLIKGMDVFHTEAIHSKIWKQLNNRAYTGVISNALSAVDIALWDLQGKIVGKSVSELLGGYSREAYTY
ncbi:MAG: mandelate racemase/muconate lactonizing enzyme family protein, partial [Mesorhizobium sp.]